MRVVGKRREAVPVLHWPTPEEVRFTQDAAAHVRAYARRGVRRYRSHAEADADMKELLGEAMARRSVRIAPRG